MRRPLSLYRLSALVSFAVLDFNTRLRTAAAERKFLERRPPPKAVDETTETIGQEGDQEEEEKDKAVSIPADGDAITNTALDDVERQRKARVAAEEEQLQERGEQEGGWMKFLQLDAAAAADTTEASVPVVPGTCGQLQDELAGSLGGGDAAGEAGANPLASACTAGTEFDPEQQIDPNEVISALGVLAEDAGADSVQRLKAKAAASCCSPRVTCLQFLQETRKPEEVEDPSFSADKITQGMNEYCKLILQKAPGEAQTNKKAVFDPTKTELKSQLGREIQETGYVTMCCAIRSEEGGATTPVDPYDNEVQKSMREAARAVSEDDVLTPIACKELSVLTRRSEELRCAEESEGTKTYVYVFDPEKMVTREQLRNRKGHPCCKLEAVQDHEGPASQRRAPTDDEATKDREENQLGSLLKAVFAKNARTAWTPWGNIKTTPAAAPPEVNKEQEAKGAKAKQTPPGLLKEQLQALFGQLQALRSRLDPFGGGGAQPAKPGFMAKRAIDYPSHPVPIPGGSGTASQVDVRRQVLPAGQGQAAAPSDDAAEEDRVIAAGGNWHYRGRNKRKRSKSCGAKGCK